jgi:hypothetical protein
MPRLLNVALVGTIWLSWCAAAAAELLPAPSMSVTLPANSPNAYAVSVAYGPDGLMYVWDGAEILRQNASLSDNYTSIGAVGSGSSDAGPLAFSRNGSQLLVGNGAGGPLGGTHAGQIFTIASAGGDSNTPVANVPFHDRFLAAPLGASNNKFFIDQGNETFTGSSVSVFDNTDGSNVPVIANIPGASSAMAIDDFGRFYVGIGFGPQRGQLRSFNLTDLENAYNTATPLDWTAGSLFNALDNNSGNGMFFDARGFLFVGGPNGITLFDGLGNSTFYDNSGFTTITYDAVFDRILVTGFGDHQGLYPASLFQVPEPSAILLTGLGLLTLVPAARRRLRRRLGA